MKILSNKCFLKMNSSEFLEILKKLQISEIFHVSKNKYLINDVIENVKFRCFHRKSDTFELYIYTIVPDENAEIIIENTCSGTMSKCIIKKIQLPNLTELSTSPFLYTGQYMNEYMKYFSLKIYQSLEKENTFRIYRNDFRKPKINDNLILKFSDDCLISYLNKEFTIDGKVELVQHSPSYIRCGKWVGKIFNIICKRKGIKLFKTLDSSLVHNGMQFEENVLLEDDDKRGIYFCDEDNLRKWSFYGGKYRHLIADVVIPDDAIVKVSTDRFSTNKIILQNIRDNFQENIDFHQHYNG